MKDVNVYYFLKYALIQQIQNAGYEITSKTYTQYGDCTIKCKSCTLGLYRTIKANYFDDDYWNVLTRKLEHSSGYSFYVQLEKGGLWRTLASKEELYEYLKEVDTYQC